MFKVQLEGQQVLKEKEMDDSYLIKEVQAYDLPVVKHQATIYYKARFRYDILQRKILEFLTACSDPLQQQQLANLLGVAEDEFDDIVQNLHQDGVVEINNNVITLSKLGINSAKDGHSPLKSAQQQLDFIYEPVTAFVVKNPWDYSYKQDKNHPIITSANYKLDECHYLDQANILSFYEELTEKSLLDNKKDFQIEHIGHQAGTTNFVIPIQELKLYHKEKTEIVHAIWNARNQKIIHLA